MSSNKKNLFKTILKINARSCGCRTPKDFVYEPKPKPKTSTPLMPQHNNSKLCSSSSSSLTQKNRDNDLSAMEIPDDQTSTSFSINIDTISATTSSLCSETESDDLPMTSKHLTSPCPKILNSIAVMKDSNDPYQDFRHSMLHMIMERQIYSENDLKKLLQCFLELNSPCHHCVIVKAFMEIWNQFISKQMSDTVSD